MTNRSTSMARRSIPHLKTLLLKTTTQSQSLHITYMPCLGDVTLCPVTLIPSDGVGPLVTSVVQQVMEAMNVPIYFETYEVHDDMPSVPAGVINSIRRNKVCLKGSLATPVSREVSSLNVQLRKELDLYASLVNCFNFPGLPTRHENVDIMVTRENTEGEYAGLEHEVIPVVVESLKILHLVATSMSRSGSRAMFYLTAAASDFYIPWKDMAEHKIQSAAGPLDMQLTQVPKCFQF